MTTQWSLFSRVTLSLAAAMTAASVQATTHYILGPLSGIPMQGMLLFY